MSQNNINIKSVIELYEFFEEIKKHFINIDKKIEENFLPIISRSISKGISNEEWKKLKYDIFPLIFHDEINNIYKAFIKETRNILVHDIIINDSVIQNFVAAYNKIIKDIIVNLKVNYDVEKEKEVLIFVFKNAKLWNNFYKVGINNPTPSSYFVKERLKYLSNYSINNLEQCRLKYILAYLNDKTPRIIKALSTNHLLEITYETNGILVITKLKRNFESFKYRYPNNYSKLRRLFYHLNKGIRTKSLELEILSKSTSEEDFVNSFIKTKSESGDCSVYFVCNNYILVLVLDTMKFLFDNFYDTNIGLSKRFYNKNGKILTTSDIQSARIYYKKSNNIRGKNELDSYFKDMQTLLS